MSVRRLVRFHIYSVSELRMMRGVADRFVPSPVPVSCLDYGKDIERQDFSAIPVLQLEHSLLHQTGKQILAFEIFQIYSFPSDLHLPFRAMAGAREREVSDRVLHQWNLSRYGLAVLPVAGVAHTERLRRAPSAAVFKINTCDMQDSKIVPVTSSSAQPTAGGIYRSKSIIKLCEISSRLNKQIILYKVSQHARCVSSHATRNGRLEVLVERPPTIQCRSTSRFQDHTDFSLRQRNICVIRQQYLILYVRIMIGTDISLFCITWQSIPRQVHGQREKGSLCS